MGTENTGQSRRIYDKEFKLEALRLVAEGGRSVRQVAQSLGIESSLLYRWRKQVLEDPEFSFPGKGRLKPPDEELRRLRKELADTKEERDILKKALAVFSRGHR